MKKSVLCVFTLLMSLLISSCSNNEHVEKASTETALAEKTAMVYGNCEQCKATIEKAGKINGVSFIDWNEDSKRLSLKMDTSMVTVDAVLKSIAVAGYDNELYNADATAYLNLPDCCQYERKQ